MRALILCGLTLVAAFAGCADDSGSDDAGTDPLQEPGTLADLPAPIYDNVTVMGSADPLNVAMQPVCSTPTAFCQSYPFTVEGNATVHLTAELTWEVPGDDFDMYVMQGATIVSNDGINNLGDTDPNSYIGTSQVLNADLPAGDYEILVVGWLVTQDTYHLAATFA